MAAFSAAHELSWSFITATRLHLPDKDQVISTLGAFHLYRWHRLYFLVFFTNDRDGGLGFALNQSPHFQLSCRSRHGFFISTLGARKHEDIFIFHIGFNWCKKTTATWAKLHAGTSWLTNFGFTNETGMGYKSFQDTACQTCLSMLVVVKKGIAYFTVLSNSLPISRSEFYKLQSVMSHSA